MRQAARLGLYLSGDLSAMHPAPLALAGVSGIAGYLHLAFVMAGAYQLEAGRPPQPLPPRLFPALALVGLAASLLFVTDADAGAWRYFARVGILALAAFGVFLVAGLRVWRAGSTRGRPALPAGPKLVGGGFFAYGLAQLQYLVLAAASLQWMRMPVHLSYLGWMDFILEWVMGLGMVVCLLEEERRAAVRASAQIEHMAYYDGLTALPNRELFIDRLALALVQAHRDGKKLAVVFLDLDRFKHINDSLAHAMGDELLRAMASGCTRPCARRHPGPPGGDEFTLLLPGISNAAGPAASPRSCSEAGRVPFHSRAGRCTSPPASG